MSFWQRLSYNIQRVMALDPAAKSPWMVFWTYPHIKALNYHYIAHALYAKGHPLLARLLAKRARRMTGIEIHPGAQIGPGLFMDHGMGIVIGETAIVGKDVTLYQGVTLGGTKLDPVKRHPTVEDHVLIGAGTKILGNVTIGQGAKIGCNVVIKQDVPAGAIVYEAPAWIKYPGQDQIVPFHKTPHSASSEPEDKG